jgi:hypothetical protein
MDLETGDIQLDAEIGFGDETEGDVSGRKS